MATVPGTPDNVSAIHPSLQPTQADLLQAAAITHQRQQQAMSFEPLADPKDEGAVEGKVPLPRSRPKKSEVDSAMQLAANAPIRSQKSLEEAIRNADSDEELQSIVSRLKRRGLMIPPQLGPGTLEQK